jgi:hypothetical protein
MMNKFQTLDKPEEKRLFGLDLHINRFHIINPDHGELLIREKKSFDLGTFWAALLFGAMAAFFLYLTFTYWQEGVPFSEWILPFLLGFIPLLITVTAVYALVTNKVQCHFTETELIRTNALGRNKIIPRNHVISVFITKQINTANGKESSFNYTVDLRMPTAHYFNGELNLLQIQEKNSIASVIGGINREAMSLAQQDALQIARVIAEHWNIPVSV